MTLGASRVEGTRNVKVTMNYGPIFGSCTEDITHVTGFRDVLTNIIDQFGADEEATK